MTRADYNRAYNRRPRNYATRAWRNMRNRVEGRTKDAHVYSGKPLLPREEFVEWATNDPEFLRLHTEWQQAGYPRRLSPSVDRVNTTGGYTPENIRWVTVSENARRR